MRAPKVRKKRGKPRYGRLEWRDGFADGILCRHGWPRQRGSVPYRRLCRTHEIKPVSHVLLRELSSRFHDFAENVIVLHVYIHMAASLVAWRKGYLNERA